MYVIINNLANKLLPNLSIIKRLIPRRKIIKIKTAELYIRRKLTEELSCHPLFQEADFDAIEIVTLKRNPDPQIKDIGSPIMRLERLVRNNGNRSVGKQKLCEITKISRPTLNKWIDDEFISKEKNKEPWAGHQKFDLEAVIGKNGKISPLKTAESDQLKEIKEQIEGK